MAMNRLRKLERGVRRLPVATAGPQADDAAVMATRSARLITSFQTRKIIWTAFAEQHPEDAVGRYESLDDVRHWTEGPAIDHGIDLVLSGRAFDGFQLLNALRLIVGIHSEAVMRAAVDPARAAVLERLGQAMDAVAAAAALSTGKREPPRPSSPSTQLAHPVATSTTTPPKGTLK